MTPRVRIYALRPGPFLALRGWLDQVEAFWAEQLDAFEAFAHDTGGSTGAGMPSPTSAHPKERTDA